MDYTKIKYYQEWISQLPKGNITYKTINGKKYPYLQWTENGKQKGRAVKQDELDELQEKINQRKELERRIKESGIEESAPEVLQDGYFFTEVKKGDELIAFAEPTKKLKKRECFGKLKDYIYGNSTDRVFILYGLRRTGKTTLIRQLISEMSGEMLSKTAFMQVRSSITLAQISIDLKRLSKNGIKYLFIDEVTLMDDFIESAALFSDIYATSGMKIVLSGTDSLGFLFSEDRELYDRCFMLHTTFVPYREFEGVLGIAGIDEYIRYGGTMSLGGIDYNNSGMTFASKETTDEYVDSAIARNIQHSLKNYQDGEHFRNLSELYLANELTSAINRIVEDINHRFTLEVLTKDFKSSDLSLSAKNLLKDKSNPSEVLYLVDTEQVTKRLKELLEIRNKGEQTVAITDLHRQEIEEYLKLLDLVIDLEVRDITDINKKAKRTAVSQPGMRYAQAESLIKTLMDDSVFNMLSLEQRNSVKQRILSDIQGRMLEDIVLLETQMAFPKCEVFKLVFARGEFDMVVFNPETSSCKIYEIKHSAERAKLQYQHLIDDEKCKQTEFRFGTITEKTVLYRGENAEVDGINYRNVEEYLRLL